MMTWGDDLAPGDDTVSPCFSVKRSVIQSVEKKCLILYASEVAFNHEKLIR